MNSMRKALCFLMATMLAAFALPGIAAAPQKQFSVAASPSTVSPGAVPAPGLNVRIKNETPNGNSSINSLTIQLPAGFTLTAAPTTAYPGQIGYSGSGSSSFSVTNMSPLKPGDSFVLNLPGVNVAAGCGSFGWGASAWTGSTLSGDTFLRVPPTALPPGYAQLTSVVAGLSASIVAPSNAVVGSTHNVSVNLAATCGTPPEANVTLSATNGATIAGPNPKMSSGGIATFAVTFTTLGTSTLTASASGGYPAPPAKDVAVWGGVLDCASTPPASGGPGWFTGSPGITDPAMASFAEGYRGLNKPGSDPCVLINFTFTNNVLGGGTTTDALGRILPQNAVSMVWDNVPGQNPAFTYTVTFKPEYAGADGLPSKKTKYCTGSGADPNDCTAADNQAVLPGCINPAVAATSIPGPPGTYPACLAGETWLTVDPSECSGYSGPPPVPACIKVTSFFIDAVDPPIIRN